MECWNCHKNIVPLPIEGHGITRFRGPARRQLRTGKNRRPVVLPAPARSLFSEIAQRSRVTIVPAMHVGRCPECGVLLKWREP